MIVGFRSGTVMFQNVFHPLAPSIFAASYTEYSIFCRPVRVPMEISFEKRAIVGGEAEETDEASDYIDGYHLDVDKLLYYEILIGWPTKTLCREDCKGLCSVCGQNLNEGTCDCEDTGLDPRMSVIRDLFKNFKEV